MKNVMPAFKFLEGDMPAPVAHKKIQCHMIFDIKMDFTRNSKISGPTSPGYRPELGPEKANYYQNLIGVLRWAVELGHIDIHVEVALLSLHLAMPRKGHLDQ
eukprot:scaffold162480_cov26-Attheya_sp.AAC.1